MSVLDIKNLTFSYDVQNVLEDVNLQVNKNDFLAIIGPNGGGKSTLLKIVLGLIPHQKGDISVFGAEFKKDLSCIGYVPQNTNINTDFPIRVIDVVMMGHVGHKRSIIGYSKDELSCAIEALSQVGMESFKEKKIGSLSGGQRQRVMIARALCAHPKLLLLDEPTANIDTQGQHQIYDLLVKLNKNITIIVVSHDISLTLRYTNKVAYINKNLTLHVNTNTNAKFIPHDEHFCEVELLQALSETKECGC